MAIRRHPDMRRKQRPVRPLARNAVSRREWQLLQDLGAISELKKKLLDETRWKDKGRKKLTGRELARREKEMLLVIDRGKRIVEELRRMRKRKKRNRP